MEGMEADEAEKALGALVSVHAPDLMPWLALIATTLGLEVAESREVAQLEDRFRPTRTAAVIGALLEATVTEPTIYAIEDAHWMDDASKELLGSLLAGLERQPWMVISTRRPGEGGFLAPAVDGTLRLWVVPLGDRDAEALIDSATGDRPLLPAQRRMLAERAQGHPLFLIELVHALRQGGDVEGLPHSVEGLIGSRIDRLPSHERNVLRRLAVLGTGFLAEHAASVMPESETKNPTRVLRHLGTFIDLDQKGRARFRHALIRDVAYQGLPYKTRRDLHQRVADSIRQSAGDNPVAQAELLSLHYFQAGGWSDAWQFSRVAGDRAKEKFANTDAAQFFERAIAAARHVEVADERQRAQVLRDLGDVREAAGLFDDALDAYRRAARLTSEDNFKVALLIVQARVLERQGAYSRALRVLTEGCRLLEASTSQEAAGARARLSARRAIVRMAQQRDREAISVALQAAAEARSTGEKEALAEAFQVLDISSTYLGLSQDLNYGELALGLYEELGDLRGQAVINGNLGIAAYFAGRWDEALSRYEKARQASLRTGNEVQAALWSANIAEILLNQGITEKAEEILREALAVMRAAGLADSAAFAEAQLGRAINVRGKVKEGEALLRSALGQFEELGEVQSLQEASVHLAACLNLAGRPEEAIAVIGEARSAGEVTVSDAPLLRVEAEALQSLRRFPAALSAAEGAVDAANQHESPYELALALLTKAGILKDLEWKGEASEVTVAHEILRGLGVVQYPAGAAELDDL
jgi:tetratricopeptide (TPR) repeat protein